MNDNQTDNFCVLRSVGPATEEQLNNNGYTTYEDLAEEQPVSLHKKSGLVLAKSTQIISDAVDQLNHSCPECGQSQFSPAWASVVIEPDSDSSLICENCNWDGKTTETNSEVEAVV